MRSQQAAANRVARLGLMIFLASTAAVATAAPLQWSPRLVRELTSWQDAKAVLRATDEVSAVIVYDSADANSRRLQNDFESAAAAVEGFGKVYAVDMRNPSLAWLLDAWNVQIVPSIRGFSWTRGVRPAWDKTTLSSVGGVRSAVEFPPDQPVTPKNFKAFVLNLQGTVPITRVENDAQVGPLMEHVSRGSHVSVVLLTNKAASSQLYKAAAITFAQRCEFFEINAAKAPASLAAFGAADLPSLFVIDVQGKRHRFADELTPTAIEAFIAPFAPSRSDTVAVKERRDNERLRRETDRRVGPLLLIDDAEEWQLDVLDRQAITGVFFFDGSKPALQRFQDAVSEYFSESGGSRLAVTRFVAVNRSTNAKLYSALCSVEGQEPAELAFISTKRKVFHRYLGTVTSGRAVADFVRGPLSRAAGSVSYSTLPAFGSM